MECGANARSRPTIIVAGREKNYCYVAQSLFLAAHPLPTTQTPTPQNMSIAASRLWQQTTHLRTALPRQLLPLPATSNPRQAIGGTVAAAAAARGISAAAGVVAEAGAAAGKTTRGKMAGTASKTTCPLCTLLESRDL